LLDFVFIGNVFFLGLDTGEDADSEFEFFLHHSFNRYLHVILNFLGIEDFAAVLYFFLYLTVDCILEFLQRLYAIDGAFAAERVAGLFIVVEGDEGLGEVIFGLKPFVVEFFDRA
jgi:hypothetical protein